MTLTQWLGTAALTSLLALAAAPAQAAPAGGTQGLKAAAGEGSDVQQVRRCYRHRGHWHCYGRRHYRPYYGYYGSPYYYGYGPGFYGPGFHLHIGPRRHRHWW
jgi:hypothetical protein